MSTRSFGERVPRTNDPRLLRGDGRYVDDIPLPNALHAAFVRSPFARARIESIDTSEALAYPGVAAVYTCDDIGGLDRTMPLLIPHSSITDGGRTQRPLAREDVYYVGQAVAMVVAINRYVAEDAVRLIDVEYEPYDVEMDLEKAIADGAPLVHSDIPNNVAAHHVEECGEVDKAFAHAEHITTLSIQVDRSTAAPMECRGVAAVWDDSSGELTMWDSTQLPVSMRGGLAALFDIDEHKVRVIAPDVGGGFGQKLMLFNPDEVLVPLAAMELKQAVKYIEDRNENFIASNQERTQIHTLELAATKDGDVIGLRDYFLHDQGAFIPYGMAVAQVGATCIAGPYRIPNFRSEFKAVYTPAVAVSPYRGAGRPHICFAIERAMDQLADELSMDRFELRRQNFIAPDEFPYQRGDVVFGDGQAVILDSGEYAKALDLALEKVDYSNFEHEQEQALKEGKYIGLGVAFYVEATGIGPYEGSQIRIHPITGKVYVNCALTTQGQGHETAWAQIVSDQLGAKIEDVIVVEGDTHIFDWGAGTYASRAAVCSGNAVHKAALKVRDQILDVASNMLEAASDDLELGNSKVWVSGVPDRSVTLAEVATISNPIRYAFSKSSEAATQFALAARHDRPPLDEGAHPGLQASGYYSPAYAAWAYGCHATIVEVDPKLCSIEFKRYVCVHDCGNMINPMIVEGQVTGGVAQGIGGAFFEHIDYDEDGNPRNANFMDFLMPFSTEIPHIDIYHLETPSPLNALGIKGVGEAGTIPVAAVLAAAVDDALKPFGVKRFMKAPLSPNMIHEALNGADAVQ